MNYRYSFEKLDVWQKARQLIIKIYKLTNKYPNEEKFGLVSQIRRSSVSITSNIAEGTSRSSLKDQIRFTEIAYGSTLELYCQLVSSLDLGFLSENDFQDIDLELKEITNKLNALKNNQTKRLNENQINK
ncbi:MAG: four helix bundle protein [Dysgonamonadaceae bacterium]|jgi:four helix bundle protein|nr:four helix bundle protein [Dysgonamonadaceae bacterium]